MTTERPNTVAGPISKRDEVIALRRKLEAETREVTCDIDYLDACIALFDPADTPEAKQRYTTKHGPQKEHGKRFALAFLGCYGAGHVPRYH